MPTFLSYFNQGPLNFEEQSISWISDLYQKLDAAIEAETGLKTKDFLLFYDKLDRWCEDNLQSFQILIQLQFALIGKIIQV